MVNIILSGANGKMGKVIADLVKARSDCKIIAGIDINNEKICEFPIYKNLNECDIIGDVVIDFSHPSALDDILSYGIKNAVPIIECTTGLSKEQIQSIEEASKTVPIFFSANMSIGVNLMAALCEKAASILGRGFDIEIVEKHHNQKIDAPSGTAIMLADKIADTFEEKPDYVYDRHSSRGKRTKSEIGLHAVRGGTIVGEHDVIFAGTDEVLTISHTAYSKGIFANGAINAAVFIVGKSAKVYDMADMITF